MLLSLMTTVGFSQTFTAGTLPGTYRSGGVTGVWDMNNDGLNDIVVMDQSTTLRILYQQANGSFIQANTATAALGQAQWGMSVGDMNNDGFGDVICGGNYDNLHYYTTDAAGNANLQTLTASIFTQAVTMGDFNNDGWLDFFSCHDDGPSKMWRNDGAGNLIYQNSIFIDANGDTLLDYNLYAGNYPGTTDPLMSGNYGNEFCDFDRDGDMDLLVAKCRQASNDPYDVRRTNLLFVNDGNNVYHDDAHNRGLVNLQQSWTATFGDIDNDGDFDCFMTTHSGGIRMYENNGLGYFTDISTQAGLTTQGFFMQGQLADFDNDGYLDVLHAGGTFGYYHNNGNGTFTAMNNLIANPQTMHGFGLGDLNNDGFTDIYSNYGNANGYVTPSNQADILWMSQPNGNHWIGFDLEGVISNKNAVGALVEIHGAFGTQIREVRSGVSYGITNSNMLVFGLGANTSVDYAVIHWPAGGMKVIMNPSVDSYHQYFEVECLNTPTASISANGSTSICAGQTVTLNATASNASYVWNNGATTSSIAVGDNGNYSVIAYNPADGCASSSNVITVTIDNQTPPSILTSGDLSYCQGGNTVLTASPGNSYLWSNGAQTQSISPQQSGIYTVQVDAGCGLIASTESIEVEVFATPSLVANDIQLNVSGPADLTATGGDIINWYADANGTTLLGTGNTLSTNVSATTTYYVESANVYPGISGSGAKPAQDATGQYSSSTFYLVFDAAQDLTIDSVLVYAQAAGTRSIELIDNTGAVIATGNFDVPAGAAYVPLNFDVPAGTGYGLRPVAGSNAQLWRDGNGSVQSYPYDVAGIATITGTTVASPNTLNYYYFFYDWHVSTPTFTCTTGLQPVTAYVGDVAGCMDGSACNYNPIATVTDNSCQYPGNPCDDGDASTINDVYTADCSCVGTSVGIEEFNFSGVLTVFPNPGVDHVQVSFASISNQSAHLKVYNSLGELVMNRNLNSVMTGANNLLVDMSSLSMGVYTIQLNQGSVTNQVRWIKK